MIVYRILGFEFTQAFALTDSKMDGEWVQVAAAV